MTASRRLDEVLATIGQLDDAELQALIGHIQGLLLDRPVQPETSAPLEVEILGREERRLLVFYRALAPLTRSRILTYTCLLYGRARRALQQPR